MMMDGNYHIWVVHLPVFAFLLYPIFICAALIFKNKKGLLQSLGIFFLFIGIIFTLFSVESGEENIQIQNISPEIYRQLQCHKSLGDTSLNLALFILVFHLFTLYIPRFKHKCRNILYILLSILLIRMIYLTGSEGVKLSHEFKVTGMRCLQLNEKHYQTIEDILPYRDKIDERYNNYQKDISPENFFISSCSGVYFQPAKDWIE